jgi:hypothetical protein
MIGIRTVLRSLLAFGWVLTFVVSTFAQGPNVGSGTVTTRDPAAAEVLFRSGRQLLLEARLEEAYSKFEESYRLDPTAGALFNLGECRWKQGKTASAWALYQQAATLADVQGKPDLMDLATTRANQLQADLSYLTVHVAAAVPGLEVMRDGVLVGRAQFDVSLPVDPGRRLIALRAPGYEPAELAVIVGEKHDRQTINLPKLKEKPLAPATTPAPPAPIVPRITETRVVETKTNPWPWVLGGVGAASLLVGTVSGILAISENHQMANDCPARLNCTNDVLLAQGRRDNDAKIAWIGIPVGIAAIGGAATWMLLARKPDRDRPTDNKLIAVGANVTNRDIFFNLDGGF